MIWGKHTGYPFSDMFDSLNTDSEKLNKLQSQYNLTFILDDDDYFEPPALKNNNFIRIKVREKGAGWTKSCGSGATAAAALLIRRLGRTLPSPIMIEQEGGVLEVHHDSSGNSGSLKLVGPSEFEYDGVWDG